MAHGLIPPLCPMLAKSKSEIPPGMAYEPKWDGFRCLIFRERDDVQLWSRSGRNLTDFFPELVLGILDNTPPRCVLDGEVVVIINDRLNFERLTQRIHPAQSRIEKLSQELPASFVAWDVLALDSTRVTEQPFEERRRLLELALGNAEAPVFLSPQTRDLAVAKNWFHQFEGAGLDGVIAKPLHDRYVFGERTMLKIKHKREADVVVAGYKPHKKSSPDYPLVGSLQLALFDQGNQLHWVGVCSALSNKLRHDFAMYLDQFILDPMSQGWCQHPWSSPAMPGQARKPGVVTRWSGERKEYLLISPFLVCTVNYEHMQGTRFRSPTSFQRWRPDREPKSCTFDQLEEIVSWNLASILQS